MIIGYLCTYLSIFIIYGIAQYSVVVYGHLHIRNTQFREGVRFEEVSLGYPQQWQAARGLTS